LRVTSRGLGDVYKRQHEEQQPPKLGATIYAKPRHDRLHLFDARTGLRM
jgi:hypothetical protein